MTGSLTIVGSGIMMVGQITLEAQSYIRAADVVYYLLTDPVTEDWVHENNPNSLSLETFYPGRVNRLDSYLEMTDAICASVRSGKDVTAVFYGHPGVFVFPSHAAIRTLRAEGLPARMLPGISAEDCLFADLGFDPALPGCQSYEATDFLVHDRRIDPRSHLVIWQVGVVGSVLYERDYDVSAGLSLLVKKLGTEIPFDHMVVVYEASRYPICPPRIDWIQLGELTNEMLTPISTLYIPPAAESEPDVAVIEELGIPFTYMRKRQELVKDPRFALIPSVGGPELV